jgi:hypothetical protein
VTSERAGDFIIEFFDVCHLDLLVNGGADVKENAYQW